jgi:hypothetical protein
VNILIPSEGCPINTISTNPMNYQNSSDASTTQVWNWMTEDFTAFYLPVGGGTNGIPLTLRNPFHELITNPNTFQFADQVEKEYHPDNGWELLGRNFGSPSQGVQNPFFILYNRFTGIIRIFINIKNTGNFAVNAATINFYFPTGTSRSAIFNQLGELTNAVNNFEPKAHSNKINQYVNSGVSDNYFWLYSDVLSLYDPCTCGLVSDLKIQVKLLSESTITLNINSTETTLVNNTLGNSTLNNESIFSEIKQWLGLGNTLVEDAAGVFTSANAAFATGQRLQNQANQFFTSNESLFGKNNTTALVRDLSRILFEVPRVNQWFKLASTLITVVEKTADGFEALTADEKLNKLKNTTITVKNTTVKATGTLNQSILQFDATMALPGSIQTGTQDFRSPIYDNILGVFNLLEQPIVKITDYNAPSSLYYEQGTFPNAYLEDNNVIDVFGTVKHVQVVNELTPILNPASGLKIKTLESRLEFINRETQLNKLKGPFIPGKLTTFSDFAFNQASNENRDDYYSNNGYNLLMFDKNFTINNKWDKALMSTAFLPQGCFSKTSLFTFSNIENIVVKVKVVLEPIVNNPNSKVEDVVIVFTYPAKVINETNAKPYQITGAIYDPSGTVMVYKPTGSNPPIGISIPGITYSPLMGMGSNSFFTNMTINQDHFVIGDITIGPGVKYEPGNFSIKATGNIYFENSAIYTVTSPNLIPNYSDYNYKFIAGDQIIVSPEVIINPETTLELDPTISLDCAVSLPILQSSSSIESYCESSSYKTRSQQKSIQDLNQEVINSDFVKKEPYINLYPNPSNGDLYVEIFNNENEILFELFSISGSKVNLLKNEIANNKYHLDLQYLSKGIYILKMYVDGEFSINQIVIN